MRRLFALVALAALLPPPVRGADLEGALNARWRGSWALIEAASASECNSFYNDNDAHGTRIDGGGAHRFAPGELAHVERIGTKRGRIDVFLDIAEQVLAARRDGPFTLYDPLHCKIQLKIPVPSSVTFEAAEAALAPLLEHFPSDALAKASSHWNRRKREPYPPDYDRTLAEYEVWKAAQLNAAVQKRMDEAIEELANILDRARTDADYAQGFAEGLEKVRSRSYGSCEGLVDETFYPDSSRGSEAHRRGAEDGQRAGFDIGLLDHLRACFVPPPPSS